MTTIKQIIKDTITAFDPTLDLSDSSSLTDLLVNPASAMMSPFVAQLNYLMNSLGVVDPEAINAAELDAIGGNFLMTRIQGSKGGGPVELLYTNPQSVTIPLGTTFTSTGGVVFAVTQELSVSQDTMGQNTWNYPYYSSGPISVEAVETGTNSSIGIGEITSTSLDPAPARVTNTSAFSGGADAESNTEFVTRLVSEIVSGAFGSATSIRTTLRKNYPTISDVIVRGMNDDEMLRDLVVSGISLYKARKTIDFYGKVSGLNSLPHPESQAYHAVFFDYPETSGLVDDLPGIEYFTQEFTNDLYEGVYALDDAQKAKIQTQIVLSDDMLDDARYSRWTFSDAMSGLGLQAAPGETNFVTHNNIEVLRMGYTYSGITVDNMPITVPSQFMYSIINYLVRSTQLPAIIGLPDVTDYLTLLEFQREALAIETSPEFANMLSQVAATIHPETAANNYPIATTPLTLHAGITATGTFETNDNSTDGRLSYVTVLRDANSIDPANGYGFAWMKGDGSVYNVYLVDNSAMANDLFVNKDNVVNPQGENAWKAATKLTILPSTSSTTHVYNYELTVGIDYSMSLTIWETGNTKPVTPQVSCGAPAALPAASGSRIGFGVMGTTNGQWWYGPVTVTTSSGVHTAVVFQLKAHATDFPDNHNVTLDYYGYGHDGEPASSAWGISAFIRKKVAGNWTWVPIGTNTSTSGDDHALTKISTSFNINNTYRDTGENVYLLATSTYAATAVTEVSSYYTALTDTSVSGVHTGGCADMYINDPSKILLAENTVNNVSGSIAMSQANGFYIPLHSIVQVQLALTGEELIMNEDWTLESGNGEAYAYSTDEHPTIVFNPSLANLAVRVVYRHYQSGESIQTMLDSPENRYSGTSNLAKCMPPCIISIDQLDYRGGPGLDAMTEAMKALVNGSGSVITRDDILNGVYAAGASWVDVVNAVINVTQYDYRRRISATQELTSSYTLPDSLSAFYADATSLNGLRRL